MVMMYVSAFYGEYCMALMDEILCCHKSSCHKYLNEKGEICTHGDTCARKALILIFYSQNK